MKSSQPLQKQRNKPLNLNMKRTTAVLASNFCCYTRNFLLSSPKLNPKRNLPVPPVAARYFGRNFFSSESESSKEPNFGHTQKPDRAADDVVVASKEELRKQIRRLNGGDEDAIPEIFESILKPKLAESDEDDDLMEEVRRGNVDDGVDDMEDEENNSDFNESDDSDTDEEVR